MVVRSANVLLREFGQAVDDSGVTFKPECAWHIGVAMIGNVQDGKSAMVRCTGRKVRMNDTGALFADGIVT
ncbi:hypothetical protein PsgB076_29155 [Pseudomonas savastanoi pv. glycinea str. B076]|nr:hypothetical protein PsgB076_29155 [Pseudomonas savastanoi pv. glycinea str. B076]